jgi:hypothetical protein
MARHDGLSAERLRDRAAGAGAPKFAAVELACCVTGPGGPGLVHEVPQGAAGQDRESVGSNERGLWQEIVLAAAWFGAAFAFHRDRLQETAVKRLPSPAESQRLSGIGRGGRIC